MTPDGLCEEEKTSDIDLLNDLDIHITTDLRS